MDRIENHIVSIIGRSLLPEDPIHARNTLEWLLRLRPDADKALRIAALGHDIERAIEERKVRRKNYGSYEEFKDAHALNSARILAEIMKEHNMGRELIDDVFYLVRHHEEGGEERTNVLCHADSISFFNVNLPYYFSRNSLEETRDRCLWGLRRLSGSLREIVVSFKYKNKELQPLLMTWISDFSRVLTPEVPTP